MSPEVTCKHAWSLRYVGSMNVELEGQICNKGLRYSQQDKRELRMLGSNRPILLMSMWLEFFALIREVFTSVDYTYKINLKRWTVFYYSDSDYMLLYLINCDLVN